jgi:hypothetical protein
MDQRTEVRNALLDTLRDVSNPDTDAAWYETWYEIRDAILDVLTNHFAAIKDNVLREAEIDVLLETMRSKFSASVADRAVQVREFRQKH